MVHTPETGTQHRPGEVARTPLQYHRLMPPTALKTPHRYEKRLDGLRSHPTVGRSVRFYFRRREQLLYLVVGGWNTVFGYAVWALMQYALGGYVPYLIVPVLAWPFGVINAYLGYRYIVFCSREPIRSELPRFSVVYLATLAVTLALLPIGLKVLPFNIYLVQASLLALIVACSYLGHKYFSFRSSPNEPLVYAPREGAAAQQELDHRPAA
jgi:putative flippase GtrA